MGSEAGSIPCISHACLLIRPVSLLLLPPTPPHDEGTVLEFSVTAATEIKMLYKNVEIFVISLVDFFCCSTNNGLTV